MYLMALTTIVIIGSGCKKQSNTNSNNNNIPGLPPATQTGANTFGFLLNGQPWVPSGNNGSGNNLSIDYDPGIRNGLFGIIAYQVNSNVDITVGLGIIDSLNFVTKAKKFYLSNNKTDFHFAIKTNDCSIIFADTISNSTGYFEISKHDKINRIISGTFEATIQKTGCIEYKITRGRFDFKF